jgi:hypothetical protein
VMVSSHGCRKPSPIRYRGPACGASAGNSNSTQQPPASATRLLPARDRSRMTSRSWAAKPDRSEQKLSPPPPKDYRTHLRTTNVRRRPRRGIPIHDRANFQQHRRRADHFPLPVTG